MYTTPTLPPFRFLLRLAVCVMLVMTVSGCSSWTPFERPLEIKTFGMVEVEEPATDPLMAVEAMAQDEVRSSLCARACSASWKWSGGKFLTHLIMGDPSVALPQWAGDTLEVRAWAPLPPDAPSAVAAKTLAKHRSQDKALIKLAELIGKLPTLTNQTLRSYLRKNPAAVQRVEAVIREESKLRPGENTDVAQGHETLARLELMPVARAVWDPPETEQATEETMNSTDDPQQKALEKQDAIRREAYLKAEKKAHDKALEVIQQIELFPDYTVRERMTNDPVAAARVQTAIKNGEISDVVYPRPGLCELTYSLRTKKLLKELK